MKEEIILVGGGGHCKSCIDVIEAEGKYQIAGIVDMPQMIGKRVMRYPVIATDNDLSQLAKRYKNYIVTVGQIKSAAIRMRLFNELKRLNVNIPVIVSPNAYKSKYSTVEAGTIIMHHVVVNAGVRIGRNCILNTKALIEHEATIGNHCHISTASVINGQCKIGDECFIGSNSVLANNIKIANKTILAAGSALLSSVKTEGGTYLGQKANRLKR